MTRATYVALLDGGKREEAVEISSDAPGRYEVRVGERTWRVDAFQADPVTLSMILDGESRTATLEAVKAGVRVHLRDSVQVLDLLDEPRLPGRGGGTGLGAAGRQTVSAPMPGRVARVLVRPGDEVRAGQALAVVEAMKMENELRSPRDGKVVEVAVAEGQIVEGGAKIAAVE